MNGLNGIGGLQDTGAAGGAAGTQGSDFDAVFQEGLVNTSAVMLQLIGGDIIQSVLKDETAVD
jgi:hypothetical protein